MSCQQLWQLIAKQEHQPPVHAKLTEAHPAAQGHSTAAGARVTRKVPAEQKAGACQRSRHAGAAGAEAQSVRVCVAAPWGPGREQMNALEHCGQL